MKVYNFRCQKCGFIIKDVIIDSKGNIYGTNDPPKCPKCGGKMKKIPSFCGTLIIPGSLASS